MAVYTYKQGQYLVFIFYYTEADMEKCFGFSIRAPDDDADGGGKGSIERIPSQGWSIRLLIPRKEGIPRSGIETATWVSKLS